MTGADSEGQARLSAGLIPTPCGPMIAVVDDDGALVRLDFFDDAEPDTSLWHGLAIAWDPAAVAAVADQLDGYFAGTRRVFDLRLAPRGNAFFQDAWRALREVPYGTTISYGALARRLSRPTSARAVGRANALNPISIVVPCHRVIGADGSLTGYGGGIDRKAALLDLEGARPRPRQETLPFDRPVPVGNAPI